MNRIGLTKEEAKWYANAVTSLLQILLRSEERNPGVKDRKTYQTLETMQEQAGQVHAALVAFGDEPFEIDVYLTKKQKEIVYEQLKGMSALLVDQVLPRAQMLNPEKFLLTKSKARQLSDMARKFR